MEQYCCELSYHIAEDACTAAPNSKFILPASQLLPHVSRLYTSWVFVTLGGSVSRFWVWEISGVQIFFYIFYLETVTTLHKLHNYILAVKRIGTTWKSAALLQGVPAVIFYFDPANITLAILLPLSSKYFVVNFGSSLLKSFSLSSFFCSLLRFIS